MYKIICKLTCSLTLRSGTLCIIETDAVGLDALSILKSAPQSAHKSLTTVLWLQPGSNSNTGYLKYGKIINNY